VRTPVALIIFNRPDQTERVFAEIARSRPDKLFVIADGPRSDHHGEEAKCAAARAIIDRVDWPCEVVKNYADVNLGCGHRPATGLAWLFEQVEEAIVLEDDCVPHHSFFRYCDDLLEHYRHDERVMHISGDNFIPWGDDAADYGFSYYPVSWGWATWRRAFKYYDPYIKLWPVLRHTTLLQELLVNAEAVEYWTKVFDKACVQGDQHGYWDYQWLFACWAQRGLSIVPRVNLVSNIGYGDHGTHTRTVNDQLANVRTGEMMFPLKHPPCMLRLREGDDAIFKKVVKPDRPFGLRHQIYRVAAALPTPLRDSIRVVRSRLTPRRASSADG